MLRNPALTAMVMIPLVTTTAITVQPSRNVTAEDVVERGVEEAEKRGAILVLLQDDTRLIHTATSVSTVDLRSADLRRPDLHLPLSVVGQRVLVGKGTVLRHTCAAIMRTIGGAVLPRCTLEDTRLRIGAAVRTTVTHAIHLLGVADLDPIALGVEVEAEAAATAPEAVAAAAHLVAVAAALTRNHPAANTRIFRDRTPRCLLRRLTRVCKARLSKTTH